MFQGLTLDQAPPIHAPLRFFLTAPLFAILAGMLILTTEPELLLNRYASVTVALVHLITLGFVTMTMIGAMQQMLPVVAGVRLPHATLLASSVHLFLVMGTLLLSGGLIWQQPILSGFAVFSLLLGLGGFTLVTLLALLKVTLVNDAIKTMRLAIFSLPIALGLGAYLVISREFHTATILHSQLIPLHLLFAFIGWVVLLIIGVSFQVVPMFYVTQAYPELYRSGLATIVVIIAIFAMVVAGVRGGHYAEKIYTPLYSMAVLAYALMTIWKLQTRKRKIPETSITYWILAMISLSLGILAWNVVTFTGEPIVPLVAVLLGVGFVISLINGMLYKIVPFLSWFHLHSKGVWDAPNMRAFIPEKQMKLQLGLHILSLVAMILSVTRLYDLFALSGIFFILSNSVLLVNLGQAVYLYQKKLPTLKQSSL